MFCAEAVVIVSKAQRRERNTVGFGRGVILAITGDYVNCTVELRTVFGSCNPEIAREEKPKARLVADVAQNRYSVKNPRTPAREST